MAISKETEKIIRAFQKDLVDFGYSGLTYEQTLEATKLALKGIGYEPEKGGTIISQFIKGWLEDEYKMLRPKLEQELKDS